MLRLSIVTVAVLLIVVGLAGCGHSKQGPQPLIGRSFQNIDLALLLSPGIDSPEKESDEQRRLEEAIGDFYAEPDEEKLRLRRNRVQDRIMAASDQVCADYMQGLHDFEAFKNYGFGLYTTVLSGLGSIFTSVSTVRALSGAATISSGLRSEFDQAMFGKMTVQVLVHGTEARRQDIRDEFLSKQNEKIESYSVEHAVGDAIRYHHACHLVAGLDHATRILSEYVKLNEVGNLNPLGRTGNSEED